MPILFLQILKNILMKIKQEKSPIPMIIYESCEAFGVEIDDEIKRDFRTWKRENKIPTRLIVYFSFISGLCPVQLKTKCAQGGAFKKGVQYLPAAHSLLSHPVDRRLFAACLRLGLNPNSLDSEGLTALQRARINGQLDCVELLATYGGV